MPIVSVIVPVYKVEPYLSRCIESILAQTFSDFELIIVDDGSPDGSAERCDEYTKIDSRIQVIHQKNSGVSRARNIGTGFAKGDYITFVDSDDWIAEIMLECLYVNCNNNKADISVVHEQIISSSDAVQPTFIGDISIMDNRSAIMYFGKRSGPSFSVPWGKLISSQIAKNELFPEDRSFAEDAACVYKWYWSAARIVNIDAKLYFYFLSEGSLCRNKLSMYHLDVFATFLDRLWFFKNNAFEELYDQYSVVFLVFCLRDIIISKAQGQDNLYQRLQGIIAHWFSNFMNLQYEGTINSSVELIELFKINNDKQGLTDHLIKRGILTFEDILRNRSGILLDRCGYKAIKRELRSLLRLKNETFSNKVKEFPGAYEMAYPKFMYLYWLCLVVKRKTANLVKRNG